MFVALLSDVLVTVGKFARPSWLKIRVSQTGILHDALLRTLFQHSISVYRHRDDRVGVAGMRVNVMTAIDAIE
jgi:hypothetical protein